MASAATVLTERPWEWGDDQLPTLRAAGWCDEAIAQTACIAAFFNYITRMADALGAEFDYTSPLERIQPDRGRPPHPAGPPVPRSARIALAILPVVAEAWGRWKHFITEGTGAFTREERPAILGRVKRLLGDPDAPGPTDEVEGRLSLVLAFAEKLTTRPWAMSAADVEKLRGVGLSDEAVLELASLAASQNAFSRLERALVLS